MTRDEEGPERQPGDAEGGEAPTGVPSTRRIGDDEVRFRRFRPGDEDRVIEVFDAAFGGFYAVDKPVDGPDYIRWFTEPHQSHHGEITVGEIGSRIGGFAGRLLREIKVGDLALYGHAGGIGGATHPDFQGRGLYQSLHGWREEREDPPLTMNLVSRARDPRATKYERLPFGKSMGVYLRVLRPWRAAADRGGFVPPGAVAFAAMMLWGRLREGSGGKEAGSTVSELPAFDERFEPFWERASAAWDVIPVRSVELLNWRFCDPRAGDFSIRIAEENGALLGYVVLQPRVHPRVRHGSARAAGPARRRSEAHRRCRPHPPRGGSVGGRMLDAARASVRGRTAPGAFRAAAAAIRPRDEPNRLDCARRECRGARLDRVAADPRPPRPRRLRRHPSGPGQRTGSLPEATGRNSLSDGANSRGLLRFRPPAHLSVTQPL